MPENKIDFKDYYGILGVPTTADKKLIQQTFRKLARKHHPDVNPGNKDSEETFKTINEAYQVLSDAKERGKYDALRAEYQQWQQTGSDQQNFNWQNWSPQTGKGPRSKPATTDDMEDLFGSASAYSDFFNNIFGNGQDRGRETSTSPRRGRDVEYEISLTLEEAFSGAERLLEIDSHRIKANIPAGVRSGSRVRLAGQGEAGRSNGQAGDLYLIIQITANATFERKGDDLHMEVSVDIFTAIAGGEIQVATLGQRVLLKIPPLTNAGRSFRLRGKGMPHLNDLKTHGDLYVLIKLVLPESLSEQEVLGIQEMASIRLNHSNFSFR